jgi:TRAP-type transport system periplasmic protein
MTNRLTRKQFLATGAATLAAPFVASRAWAAKTYVIKFGDDLPIDHPTTTHVEAAAAEIKAATHGAVILQVFPNNQLGDDTHMFSNLRLGAMEMMSIGDNILANLVPDATIDNVGFAFKDSKTAWAALDGEVGALIRPQIEKAGLHPLYNIWDMGFREITTSTKPINTPQDLAGIKIRVPPSQMNLSIFKDLGAAPVTLNIAELYTALQTKIVDGQETPLGVVETSKWYQVQKYCSLTNHMWVGNWMVINGAFWNSLPKEYQHVMETALNKAARAQRVANAKLNGSMQAKLESQGLIFNTPDHAAFRQALVKAGYYKEWQGKLGPTLWSALEKYTGTLS